jgi:NDP-sugar pyrophosphorylase family protein
MLPLGGRPILERLVEHLRQQGFSQLFLSVNYRSEVIEEHFGDGSRWGMQVSYLRETESRGTAGSLGLLDPEPYSTIVLVNGDLVTELNFERLLEFHYGHEGEVTVGSKKYQFDVPFGVLELEGDLVTEIKEKPRTTFQVSAGIYVFKARALEGIEWTGVIDMPELIRHLMRRGARVQAFPIREKWIDIGTPDDYQRALAEYKSGEDNV